LLTCDPNAHTYADGHVRFRVWPRTSYSTYRNPCGTFLAYSLFCKHFKLPSFPPRLIFLEASVSEILPGIQSGYLSGRKISRQFRLSPLSPQRSKCQKYCHLGKSWESFPARTVNHGNKIHCCYHTSPPSVKYISAKPFIAPKRLAFPPRGLIM